MDAGDCAPSFAAFASYAVNELGHDMVEFAFRCKLINLMFDFGGFIILYRQTAFPSLFHCPYVVLLKKLSALPGVFCFGVNRPVFLNRALSSPHKPAVLKPLIQYRRRVAHLSAERM
jgi:hypothetical protein